MSHTPGPWALFGSNYHDHIEVQARRTGDLVTIAKVICPEADMHGPMPCEDPQAVANARLIAAAPDLLAALERLMIASLGKPFTEAHKNAKATIAKAKGGAS